MYTTCTCSMVGHSPSPPPLSPPPLLRRLRFYQKSLTALGVSCFDPHVPSPPFPPFPLPLPHPLSLFLYPLPISLLPSLNNNTQKAAIASPPSATHPQLWAELHTHVHVSIQECTLSHLHLHPQVHAHASTHTLHAATDA